MLWKRKIKSVIDYRYINKWQAKVLESLGLTVESDSKTIKEACRRVLLETGRLYENTCRVENGMKPIEYD